MERLLIAGLLAAAGTVPLLARAFRALPGARWQFVAAVPVGAPVDGVWRGVNLTYYGVFSATAYAAALALFLVLGGALGVSAGALLAVAGLVLAVGVPASRWMAALVERKRHTFTVGGASCVGFLAAPWLMQAWNAWRAAAGLAPLPVLPLLAALAVAYCLGEGLGRLACISFGCCYARPLDTYPHWVQWLFAGRAFVFRGATKKIAYAAGLDGVPVLPVQALTAAVLLAAAWSGALLFLAGLPTAALVLAAGVSQGWRALTECWRADFRGTAAQRGVGFYQGLALLALLYGLALPWLLPPAPAAPAPDLLRGLRAAAGAPVLLALQGVWLAIFLYTGVSRVTDSTLAFRVRPDKL